jgi:hypothetical protein
MIHIRFWWSGYSPEEALTTFDPVVLEMPFEVSSNGGESWRPPQNGATLQTIYEWMVDHDRTILDTKQVNERHNGRWEGQYVLTIGPNGERS